MIQRQHNGQARAAVSELKAGFSRRSALKAAGVGTAAVGSLSVLSACGSKDDSKGTSGGSGGKAEDFSVAAFPGDTYLIDIVAADQKLYEKHSLKVPKHLTPQSGVQAFQLLVANGVDGYAGDTTLLMATHANSSAGKRPVMVGIRGPETTYGIVGRKDISWPAESASFKEKIAALKGHTVGVTAVGAGADLQLKLALEEAGMTEGDVTVIAVGPTAQAIPNMNQGRIDAYVTVQWIAARHLAKETGGTILADFSHEGTPDILRNQAVLSIAVREETAKEKESVVKNWLATQEEAKQWILDNKDKAAELLNQNGLGGKSLDIAKEYIEHFEKAVVPKLKADFKADKETVDRMISLAEKFGSIKKKGSVTFENLVPEFARA